MNEYKEKDNICNLPTVATINIHKSKETGKWYIEYIDKSTGDGNWKEHEITEEFAKMMISYCHKELIYEVCHDEEGKFIGHGLYEDIFVVDSIHATEESANSEAKRMHEETGYYYYVKCCEVKR